MWQMEVFRNHQWHAVSHSGLKNEFDTKVDAEKALDVLFPPETRPATGGGASLHRVVEVQK